METMFKLTEIYLYLVKEKKRLKDELKNHIDINRNVAKLEEILSLIDYMDKQIEIQAIKDN